MGLEKIEMNGKWGYIDKTGREVIPVKYDTISDFKRGLAKVKLDGKWGIINENGKEIIPPKYDDVMSFKDKTVKVRLNDKWKFGYIGGANRIVIPIIYDFIGKFNEDGLAKVKLNGKWGYIDKTGKTVKITNPKELKEIKSAMVNVKLNNKYGFYRGRGD